MKNEDHPLVRALSRDKGSAGGDSKMLDFDEIPTYLNLKHSDIPGLPGRKVGEQITVNVSGHIHSQHNDGHAVMEVHHIAPDSPTEESFGEPDAIRVIPPSSNVPS